MCARGVGVGVGAGCVCTCVYLKGLLHPLVTSDHFFRLWSPLLDWLDLELGAGEFSTPMGRGTAPCVSVLQ